ncbi:MAG TPA: Uma2 family endonuclease [Tepidisphaeraceae bacterium]|jgi:Uma2 family endonuclease
MASRALSTFPDAPPSADRVRMTYEEFLESDTFHGPVEWVNGEVVPMAPVSNEHSIINIWLVRILGEFVERENLGQVYGEPFQMKIGAEFSRSPDVFFVAKKNLNRVKSSHLEGPADLVVEVISPGSRALDRGNKYVEYEQGGVREYWLIDPERKMAEFYQLGRDRTYQNVLVGGAADGIYRSVVIKGLWLETDWLWRRPLPTLKSILKAWKML